MKKRYLAFVCFLIFVLIFASSCSSGAQNADSSIEHTITTSSWTRTGNFSGQTLDGIPHGQGTFTTVNDYGVRWIYTGAFAYGHFNGYGRMVWQNGQLQEGFFVDSLIVEGRLYNEHGELTFEGLFAYGAPVTPGQVEVEQYNLTAQDSDQQSLIGTWSWSGLPYYVFNADGSGTMSGSSINWWTGRGILFICTTPAACNSHCFAPSEWNYVLSHTELILTNPLFPALSYTYTRLAPTAPTSITDNIYETDTIVDIVLERDGSMATQTELSTGTFSVGRDIPAGRYIITTSSREAGNFTISRSGRLLVNEILSDRVDFGVSSITVDILDWDTITISGLDRVDFTPAETSLSNILSTGHWVVGLDIEAGDYVVTAIYYDAGNFTVHSGDRLAVNEILTGRSDGFGESILTITLYDGQLVRISGLNGVNFTRINVQQEPEDEQVVMVWLSATGTRWHAINNCGNMNPATARNVTLEYVRSRADFGPCNNCNPPR